MAARALPLLQGGIYTLPSHLSPGARDLIPRMLLVDPLKRITIPEIRRGAALQEDTLSIEAACMLQLWRRSRPMLPAGQPGASGAIACMQVALEQTPCPFCAAGSTRGSLCTYHDTWRSCRFAPGERACCCWWYAVQCRSSLHRQACVNAPPSPETAPPSSKAGLARVMLCSRLAGAGGRTPTSPPSADRPLCTSPSQLLSLPACRPALPPCRPTPWLRGHT